MILLSTKGKLFFFFLLASVGLQAQFAPEIAHKIYDVNQQKEITLDELAAGMEEVDVLFWGETHDDSLGHVLQSQLYTRLLNKYGRVTLSMEMFETDCQYVLDEYLAGFITEDKMIKDARAWRNYDPAYRRMVEEARNRSQVVIAANAPRRYVNMISRKGLEVLPQLPKTSREYLPPLPIYTADSAYYERFQEAMGGAGHGMSDNFYYAQCMWDASMSYQVYRHWKKHKKELIFHLNGSFHTDFRQGTYGQLQRLNKKLNLRNISCKKVNNLEEVFWEEYKDLADFIIVTGN
ncbi:MAG: ChaN family lipoprotein [Bacteroidota bacterium]